MRQLSHQEFERVLHGAFYYAEEELVYNVTSDYQKFVYAEVYFGGKVLEVVMYDALGEDFLIEVHEKNNPYFYYTLYNDNGFWWGHDIEREEHVKKCIERFA